MQIIEQVRVQPNFNLKLDIVQGSLVKLLVVEEDNKVDSIQLNLLKSSNDRLALELIILNNKDTGRTILVIENLENCKANYDKLKIFLNKFKDIFNKVQNITGNHIVITAKIDSKKLDWKKKKLQIYSYNFETKLADAMFECEVKVDNNRVQELEQLFQDVLEQDIVVESIF